MSLRLVALLLSAALLPAIAQSAADAVVDVASEAGSGGGDGGSRWGAQEAHAWTSAEAAPPTPPTSTVWPLAPARASNLRAATTTRATEVGASLSTSSTSRWTTTALITPVRKLVDADMGGEASESSDSIVDQVQALADEYLIPYGVAAAGFLFLLLVFCCCWCRARRRRRRKKQTEKEKALSEDEEDPPLFGGRQELPPAVERQASGSSSSGLRATPKEAPEKSPGNAPERRQDQETPTGSRSSDLLGPGNENDKGSHPTPPADTIPTGSSGGRGLSAAPFYGGNLPPSSGSAGSKGALLSGSEDLDDSRPVDDDTPLNVRPEAQQISPMALETWVRKVYARYNPKKLDRVDDLLAEYKGREQELMDVIKHKYRLDPSHHEHHYSRSAARSASCGACESPNPGGCGTGDGGILLTCGVLPDFGGMSGSGSTGASLRQRPLFTSPPPALPAAPTPPPPADARPARTPLPTVLLQ